MRPTEKRGHDGFHPAAVDVLRCPVDGNSLELDTAGAQVEATPIRAGALRCRGCASSFPIEDGILSLLDAGALEPEQAHESREEIAALAASLEALGDVTGRRVLGVGSGTGRYTTELLRTAALVVAVDLSREALRVAAERLGRGAAVALVHADCTTLKVRPASFDVAFATLVSNLPTAQHRSAFLAGVRGRAALWRAARVHHPPLRLAAAAGPGAASRVLQGKSYLSLSVQEGRDRARGEQALLPRSL
jgi:uncharacterized protein YbaR (Trm112 family)